MRGRRTSRGYRETQTPETEPDRDLSGRNTRDRFGDHERIETRGAVSFSETVHLLLQGLQSAHSAAPYYSYAGTIFTLQVQLTVTQSLICHTHGELGIAVHLTRLFAIDICLGIEVLHLARELSLEQTRIKRSNRRDSAHSFHQRFPCIRRGITHRGKRTKTCYNNSF